MSKKESSRRVIALILALSMPASVTGCASSTFSSDDVLAEPTIPETTLANSETAPPSEVGTQVTAETTQTTDLSSIPIEAAEPSTGPTPTSEQTEETAETTPDPTSQDLSTQAPSEVSENNDSPADIDLEETAEDPSEPTLPNSDTPVPSEAQEDNAPPESSGSTEAVSPTPTQPNNSTPATSPEPVIIDFEEEPDDGLTPTQRNSINMLNYMTVLTQEINEARGNQLFLESAYSSLVNDLYPNAVDTKTQGQITSLMDTINEYRMISVKRQRLEYIYEQNRAQAMRQAIPNPMGLLSAVQSGSLLKAAASVLYMAVDSVASYQSATSQADLEFLKAGWELDDAESTQLHNSTKDALSYMLNMVRDYDLPGDYALNKESVETFVLWSGKPDSQLIAKISWLESHESTYEAFGPYWLELAKDYYNSNEYRKCMNAISQYEAVSTRIFRKDIDYAQALPMAIISAKETFGKNRYSETAANYCQVIMDNTKDADWALRYFVAQIYLDLYAITNEAVYLDKAYKIAYDNVVILVDEQRALNDTYMADIVEARAEPGATKREKDEAKSYNKLIKEERKVALPPVSEALYLNCDLLFALAEQRNIRTSEKNKIESILHVNGEHIFLTSALDARFWFKHNGSDIDADNFDVSFNGEKFIIPATCVSDRSIITATITGVNGIADLIDWTVAEVKRPKDAECDQFSVTFMSKDGKAYKYQEGERITIRVVPVAEAPDEYFEFTYNVVKKAGWFGTPLFSGIVFEREI